MKDIIATLEAKREAARAERRPTGVEFGERFLEALGG